MSKALAIFAIFIALASASGVLFPAELLSFGREVIAGPGLWWAAGARMALAVLLWISAPVSRTPGAFRVLSILALFGATFIVVVGSDGVLKIVDWLYSWPLWAVRFESLIGVAFGAFLFWSVRSKRAEEDT
jgi:hypothetical protein